MGNKHGHKLDRKASQQYVETTNFNEPEVQSLHGYFNDIAKNKVKKELVIDRNIFKAALGLKESLFINRMFLMFDTDGDGHINFEEFLNGISLMCETGDFDEKVQFSFQVYDFDGDGLISKTELTEMCKADIVEMNLDMTPEEIDIFVSATMSQVSNGGETISYDQYNAYAQNNREKFQAEMTVKIKERCMGGTVH